MPLQVMRSIAAEASCFHHVPLSVTCQHGLIRRAGKSITHAATEASNDRGLSLARSNKTVRYIQEAYRSFKTCITGTFFSISL